MSWLRLALVFGIWQTASCSTAEEKTFANPVAERGADPWVIKHAGRYHYCFSRRGAVWVASADTLRDVFTAKPVEVWRPERGKPWSRSLWAPELHYLQGEWYIYVAADDGKNENHRMQVLRRRNLLPDGPFERVDGFVLPENRWSIDGTALEVRGKLYHVWSGWPGETNGRQDLYICEMADPATPRGPRVLISEPELDWEKRGGSPAVNEGPSALVHRGRTFLIYSASGSWSDHYCLGLLELVGKDPMDPAAWKKHPDPWFQSRGDIIAPGHASVVLSPDGREHWLVYHSAHHPGAGWSRQVNLQKFTFDQKTGLPVIGQPIGKGIPQRAPSD